MTITAAPTPAQRTVRLTARVQENSRPAVVSAAWLRGCFAHDIAVDVLDVSAEGALVHATVVCDLSRVPQAQVLLDNPTATDLWHKTIEAQFIGGWCDVAGEA